MKISYSNYDNACAQAADAMEKRGDLPPVALPPQRSLGRTPQVVSPFSATERPLTTAPLRQVCATSDRMQISSKFSGDYGLRWYRRNRGNLFNDMQSRDD